MNYSRKIEELEIRVTKLEHKRECEEGRHEWIIADREAILSFISASKSPTAELWCKHCYKTKKELGMDGANPLGRNQAT